MLFGVSRRVRMAWLSVVLLGELQSSAAAQAKLPLPPPGVEHPALFLRLMTRLCGELERAAAAGVLTGFLPGEALLKEGSLELVERSAVKVRPAHDGKWVLVGPLAVGARIDPFNLPSESTSCSAGNSATLHEDVRWASCELRASQGSRCRLEVEWVFRMPRRMDIEPSEEAMLQSLEAMMPRRAFVLTFTAAPRKPLRPASTLPNKGMSP